MYAVLLLLSYLKYCIAQYVDCKTQCTCSTACCITHLILPVPADKTCPFITLVTMENIIKFQHNLTNSKTLYTYTLPPLLLPKFYFPVSFMQSLIGDHRMDGPSPKALSPVVINWNQWSKQSLSWNNYLAESWWKFSVLPKGSHFEPGSQLPWLATKARKVSLQDNHNFPFKNPAKFSL